MGCGIVLPYSAAQGSDPAALESPVSDGLLYETVPDRGMSETDPTEGKGNGRPIRSASAVVGLFSRIVQPCLRKKDTQSFSPNLKVEDFSRRRKWGEAHTFAPPW